MNTQDLSTQLAHYDDLAVKHKAALAAWDVLDSSLHPKPEWVEPARDNNILILVLLIIMLAAMWVSGSRTIEAFGGGSVGIAGAIVGEGAIVGLSFYRTRRHYNESRLDTVHRWATVGLSLSIAMIISANIESVFQQHGIVLSGWIKVAINTALAIVAPIMAFIIGDVLAIETIAHLIKVNRERRAYEAVVQEWEAGRNRRWNSQKANWGIRVEVAPRELEAVNSLNLIKSNGLMGRNKPSPKLNKALVWLREHPDKWEVAPRELEADIEGVSYGTIFKAQQMLRQEIKGD